MRAPKRIQRRRTKGWRMPEGAVYVGRPTYWGNPWKVSDDRPIERVILTYRKYVLNTCIGDDAKKVLAGKDLVCWCPLDAPCHADVLLEIANAE